METLLRFVEQNWPLIRKAPATFFLFGGLTFLAGYAVASWGDSGVISTLQERIKLKDDQLARDSKAWEQDFIEKRREVDGEMPIMKDRELGALYQDGKKVGRADEPPRLLGVALLEFESLVLSADFDESKNFEYNDLVLRIQKIATRSDGSKKLGAFCGIVEHRR